MTKTIEILKAGTFTAMSGREVSFTAADLEAAATAYDPTLSEAPLVVGHPKTDAPAYGWVKGLKVVDGALVAEPDQVDPAFAELVEAGRFKKVSASLYAPTAKNNPKPGSWYLRHVGFLGAQPPAVKGLKAIELGETEEDVVEFSDGWTLSTIAGLFRTLRDWLVEKHGQEEADQRLPGYTIDWLISEGARQTAKQEPAFSEPPKPDAATLARPQEAEAAAAEQRRRAEAAETQLAEQAAQRRRDEVTALVTDLVKQNKVLPAERDGLIAFMAGDADDQVVSFGEGETRTETRRGQWLREFLNGLPDRVDLSERAPRGTGIAADDALALAEAARSYQAGQKAKGIEVSVTEAVRFVSKGA